MLDPSARGFWIARDADRFGERHDLRTGALSIKVSTENSRGTLLAFELVHRAQGGPPRHLHREQDEWFYVVEGEYVIEVGEERFQLNPGDSVFAPRQIAHGWAFVGDHTGRLACTVTPAGQLEAFFRQLSKLGAMGPQDPAFWTPYGLELVGPPIDI